MGSHYPIIHLRRLERENVCCVQKQNQTEKKNAAKKMQEVDETL